MKFKPNQTRTYDGEGFKRRAACLCFKNEKEDEVSHKFEQQWSLIGEGKRVYQLCYRCISKSHFMPWTLSDCRTVGYPALYVHVDRAVTYTHSHWRLGFTLFVFVCVCVCERHQVSAAFNLAGRDQAGAWPLAEGSDNSPIKQQSCCHWNRQPGKDAVIMNMSHKCFLSLSWQGSLCWTVYQRQDSLNLCNLFKCVCVLNDVKQHRNAPQLVNALLF